MASDALLTLLPFVGNGNGGAGTAVSATNEATFSVLQGTTGVTALGVGPNPGTSTTVANSATSAASNYLDLKTLQGTRKGHPLVAYILYEQAVTVGAASTGTILFTIDHADDSPTSPGTPGTWQVYGASDEGSISLSTTAVSGAAHITLARTKRYVRLNAFIAASGGATASVPVARADIRETNP